MADTIDPTTGLPLKPQGNGVTNFLNSPGGAAVINAVGGAATAYGNNKQSEAQQQQNASQFAASQLANQSTQDRQNAQAAATPLGESQNFVAKNALLNAILPNFRNANSGVGLRPGAGSFLPDGGLNPQMVNSLYGATPTLESLAQRGKQLASINPQAPQENFANLGGFGDQKAAPFMQSVSNFQGDVAGKQDAQRDEITKYVQQGMEQENQTSSNPSDGFWHKFAKWAGIAGAGVATAMTGGAAAPLLIAAIGAGSAAANAWGSGSGAAGAATAAGLNAAAPIAKSIIGTGKK